MLNERSFPLENELLFFVCKLDTMNPASIGKRKEFELLMALIIDFESILSFEL